MYMFNYYGPMALYVRIKALLYLHIKRVGGLRCGHSPIKWGPSKEGVRGGVLGTGGINNWSYKKRGY